MKEIKRIRERKIQNVPRCYSERLGEALLTQQRVLSLHPRFDILPSACINSYARDPCESRIVPRLFSHRGDENSA